MSLEKVKTPTYYPGHCYSCGGVPQDREWFVSMNYFEDYIGAAYLCDHCFDSFAKKVGYITAEKAALERLDLENANLILKKDVERYAKLISSLSDYGIDLGVFIDRINDPLVVESVQRATGKLFGSNERPPDSTRTASEGTVEQDSGGEFGRVSTTTGYELNI